MIFNLIAPAIITGVTQLYMILRKSFQCNYYYLMGKLIDHVHTQLF